MTKDSSCPSKPLKLSPEHSPVLHPTTALNCRTANDTQLRQPMMQPTCAEACKPRNASSLPELFIPPPVSDRHGTAVCTTVLVKSGGQRGEGLLCCKEANQPPSSCSYPAHELQPPRRSYQELSRPPAVG